MKLQSKNIRSAFALSFCMGMLEQIVRGPVLVLYLYHIAESQQAWAARGPNLAVGFVQGVSGLVKLASVAPISWLVDSVPTRRVRPLRVSIVLGFITVVAGGFSLYTDHIAWATTLSAACGLFMELAQSASRAILTDSIPVGKREGIFVTQWVCFLAGSATGPFLAAVVILVSESTEQAHSIQADKLPVKFALLCGLIVVIPAAIVIFNFGDPLAAEVESRGRSGDVVTVNVVKDVAKPCKLLCCAGRVVPMLCLAFSLATTCAGGMMVPFFDLFFVKDVHLSLVQVNLLEGFSFFFISACSKAALWISRYCGRAITMLCFFTVCTGLTFSLSFELPAPILVALFLVRRGIGNCLKPLNDSMVADYTNSTRRGMWNALLSLGMAGWAGAALLGGVMADAHGYTFVIFVTSLIYAGSLCFLVPLVGLVPRKVDTATENTSPSTGTDTSESSS